jgi:hypothetical protein
MVSPVICLTGSLQVPSAGSLFLALLRLLSRLGAGQSNGRLWLPVLLKQLADEKVIILILATISELDPHPCPAWRELGHISATPHYDASFCVQRTYKVPLLLINLSIS